jgi:MFS superfamily sulfate permease-like transporter
MGIALASGAPIYAGLISGVIGGVVVGWLSPSGVSVSGPAAGLTVVVLQGIASQGSFPLFLVSVFLAGIFQLLLGFFRAGFVIHFVPHSVIKGMLAAIGLILLLKQVPHALGIDTNFEGDEHFVQSDGRNTFSEILYAFDYFSPGAFTIALVGLVIMIFWDSRLVQKNVLFRTVPSSLLAVVAGVVVSEFFTHFSSSLMLDQAHMVAIPDASYAQLIQAVEFPDWSALGALSTYALAVTIALIASLESLLSLEATDRLDPQKRISDPNQELKAQGIGNILCGLVGAIPVTAVIVRSSANITAGGRSRKSAILHGFLLLVCVVFFASILQKVPLASLAAVLLFIGYKLTPPSLYISMYQKGAHQFIPFVITVVAILLSNLLLGIVIGLVVGLLFVLRGQNDFNVVLLHKEDTYTLLLSKRLTFLHKQPLKDKLATIPNDSNFTLDASLAEVLDEDALEILEEFLQTAAQKSIGVTILDSKVKPGLFNKKVA